MTEQCQKCERKIKLFAFIPLYSWKNRGSKKIWKIFGIKVFKRKTNNDNSKVKYYFCGIPVMKVVKEYK